MNNFIDMNDVEQLIIDKLTGQIGDEEESRLEQLIARHHEVEQLWQQMQQVYAMRKAVSFENSFDADAAWQKLQKRVDIDTVPQAEPDTVAIQSRVRPAYWKRYAMAAAVAGIVILGVYLYTGSNRQGVATAKTIQVKLANGQLVQADSTNAWLSRARQMNIDPGAWNTITVPAGKMFNFQLADGSEIWLNAASELKFPLSFTGVRRELQLKGEGYFKVAHKAEQPFVVTINGLRVTALGTEFNIRSYESSMVALVSGSVMVQNSRGEQVILQPGEAVNSELHKDPFDEQMVLAWMKGLYYFRNEKLHDIRVIAERWFDVEIVVEEGLKEVRFTGALNRNKPVEGFLEVLMSTGVVKYERRGEKIFISKN